MTDRRIMTRLFLLLCAVALAVALWGCGSDASYTKVPDFEEKAVRLIAVMPLSAPGMDETAAGDIRKLLYEELFFKGYPKVPLDLVDEKLQEAYPAGASGERGTIPPEAVGRLLGVDAVLYGTIEEWKSRSILFYAPTEIRMTLALRSAATGETLWRSEGGAVRRTWGFPKKSLEVKTVIASDEVLHEGVAKTLSGFPDGPHAVGMAVPKKGFFEKWWPFGS